MSIYKFDLEPITYQRPRFCSKGAYNNNSYTKAKKELSFFMQRYCKSPHEAPLKITINFYFKKPKRPSKKWPSRCDIDNLIKAVCDAGNGILWHDDRDIVTIESSKHYCTESSIVLKVETCPID